LKEGNGILEMTSTECLELYKSYCNEHGERWEKGAGSAAGLSMKINNSDICDKSKATKAEKRRAGSFRIFDIDKMVAHFVAKGQMRYEEHSGGGQQQIQDEVEECD
jgi:hypothetical protein